ncbi:MAG TPA: hypothetical protein VIJ93_09135 [bacterium]
MKDLIILGTGVHGAEMVEIVERVNADKKTWNLIGFLSFDKAQKGRSFNQTPVLGSFDDIPGFSKAFFIPNNKWNRSTPLPMNRVTSLIDPTTFISRTAQIGKGVVLYPNCYVGLQAKIGDFVFSLSNSVINHDVVLETGVIVTSGVMLAGSVHVEEGCYLGQACTVREKLRIGKGSLIGMGTVVTKDVVPNSVMVGCPAKKLKDRFPDK